MGTVNMDLARHRKLHYSTVRNSNSKDLTLFGSRYGNMRIRVHHTFHDHLVG